MDLELYGRPMPTGADLQLNARHSATRAAACRADPAAYHPADRLANGAAGRRTSLRAPIPVQWRRPVRLADDLPVGLSNLQTFILAGCAALAVGTCAQADPCEAIPDNSPVPVYLQPGRSFSGPVVRVLDGDSLCVAVGSGPASWVEVRLSDFYAAESSSAGGPAAKAALERIALGKVAHCIAGRQSYDRVVSACTISGLAIGQMLRSTGIQEGGRGYTETPSQPEPRRRVQRAPTAPEAIGYGPQFRSCREARTAGAAPMYRGQPGYSAALDGDGDGIACEPYRSR